jgi:hypothetical protein
MNNVGYIISYNLNKFYVITRIPFMCEGGQLRYLENIKAYVIGGDIRQPLPYVGWAWSSC